MTVKAEFKPTEERQEPTSRTEEHYGTHQNPGAEEEDRVSVFTAGQVKRLQKEVTQMWLFMWFHLLYRTGATRFSLI